MSTATVAYVSTPLISLGGQSDAALAGDLVSLAAEETVVGMAWCEARFNNFGYRNGSPGYLYLARDRIDFGTTMGVTVGAGSQSRAGLHRQGQRHPGGLSGVGACPGAGLR